MDVKLRARSGYCEIEEQACFVGPICDAWKYLYEDYPHEHYHLCRLLIYFKEQSEECWGGMPAVTEELFFLLEIVEMITDDRILTLKNIINEPAQ